MVTIILPTYNESGNIIELIDRLYASIPDPLEVLVVDDDSPDRTWELAQRHKNGGVKVIRRQGERGLSTAIARGIKEARGELIGWMDADLGMPPEVLPEMIKSLETNDIAIGSRYVKDGRDSRGFFRCFTSKLINGFASFLLGFGIKDYDSGFIVLRKTVFSRVPFPEAAYGEYFIELLYKSLKAGFTVKEVPYTFKDRTRGASKTAASFSGFFILGFGYVTRILSLKFSKDKV